MAIPTFVDQVTLHVYGGHGGNGCASIHREKFKPLGGPDGGNGGDGGSVILRIDHGLTTLVSYHRQAHWRATSGQPGRGDNQNGARGDDVILLVPNGTVVNDAETGTQIADLTADQTELVIAQGGRGGLGNAALASPARKAPGFALLGEQGETRRITLELKVVADIGLVGLPSAGKSSLVAAISRARPKIADYPFTTLVPNLGVVVAGDISFTVADVPGLIAGASEGRGLGFDFLRHIERCAAIVHVIDCATYEPGRDPMTDLDVIEAELKAHGGLEDRPRLVALNKIDIPDAQQVADFAIGELRDRGLQVFPISTRSGQGLRELIYAMARLITARRATEPPPPPARIIIRPKPIDDQSGFTVEREGELWRVRGTKPERWVRQTDFANAEAVGYLADRLHRIGIEDRLLELGAQPGDGVAIGGEHAVIFDFAPQIDIGAEILSSRGHDQRLTEDRPAVQRRRDKDRAYHAPEQADGADTDGPVTSSGEIRADSGNDDA